MRLKEYGGAWSRELPYVLWAIKMIEKTSTIETPFSLAFGMDVVTLVEIGLPSF